MQQTIYLATANTGSEDKDDIFKIVSHMSAPNTVNVADKGAEASCKLESLRRYPGLRALIG